MTWTEQAGRAIVYARSHGRCEVCGRPADSYHHRNKQGRLWNPANGLHLCGDGTRWCHAWIEANPRHAMSLGLWVPRTTDPATVPVYLRPATLWRAWWIMDDAGCFTWMDNTPPPDHPDTADRLRAVLSLTTARGLTLDTLNM